MSHRSLVASAVAAALLAPSSGAAQPSEPAPSEADPAVYVPADGSDASGAPVVDEDERPRVHQHAFGAGYRGFTVSASDGTRYFLSGPTGAYSYFVGRRWGFYIGGEGSYLVHGRMASLAGDFDDALRARYDERTYAFDLQLLAARRMELTPSLALTLGGGIHVQAFVLRGSQYLPVEAITGGFGGIAKVDWLVNSWFSLQATASVGLDALDFVRHVNPATLVAPMSLTLGVGVRR